jgi:ATP-dependent DNA ligase
VRQKHFVNDEVVVLDKDGASDFGALHSRKDDKRAQFCASRCPLVANKFFINSLPKCNT